jgi:hypothetical protein
MSDPIRYNVKCGDEGYHVVESLGGEWVRYGDYARLKAEVERLTKAGDAMAMTLQADYNGVPYEPPVVINAIIYWRAAKEDKQS